MTRPQESHCDLGLDLAADRTPEMRKAPTVAPVDAEIRNPTSKQEKIMTSTAHPTDTVTLVDRMAAIVKRCTELGLTATVEKAGIRVLGLDDKEIVCSRDLDEVERAVDNYWPDDLYTLHIDLGAGRWITQATVSATAAFDGDKAAVYLDVAAQHHITVEQAADLAAALTEAVRRVTAA